MQTRQGELGVGWFCNASGFPPPFKCHFLSYSRKYAVLSGAGMSACPFIYIWFVPEMMKIKQHWQTSVSRRGAHAPRKPEAAVPRMSGFIGGATGHCGGTPHSCGRDPRDLMSCRINPAFLPKPCNLAYHSVKVRSSAWRRSLFAHRRPFC